MTTNLGTEKIWGVVVVGGGPAGMMAAGRAGELGKKVLLLEKNAGLGKKLLITGGGRCNLTNNKPNIRNLLAKYKGNNKFLFSCFSQYAVSETLEFFHLQNMPTKEEAEERVFPLSNTAQSVWDALTKYIKNSKVKIQTSCLVTDILQNCETKIFIIKLKNGKEILTKSCILATGGNSHPETGSTGEGFLWLKKFGHKIIENNFSLVPVALKDTWAKKLGGVSLKDIKLTTFQNGQKQEVQTGKMLFTHFGISGPAVLNMSKGVGDLLMYGDVQIVLDLFPSLDPGQLKQKVNGLFASQSKKLMKNTLSQLISSALVSPVLELSGVSGEDINHNITKENRAKLIQTIKNIPLNVKGLLGSDKAVISSGGIDPVEVDFKTMESKLLPNLYVVGDLLNIDRPSGGYSLQLCWTTGFVAGNSCK